MTEPVNVRGHRTSPGPVRKQPPYLLGNQVAEMTARRHAEPDDLRPATRLASSRRRPHLTRAPGPLAPVA